MEVKKIEIRVIPNAKKAEVKESKAYGLKVKVNAPAVNNKANKAVIAALSDYFKVKKGQIKIIKGEHSSNKTIELTIS